MLALFLVAGCCTWAWAQPASPVVVRAGGVDLTERDLRRHGAVNGDAKKVGQAVQRARIEAALAAEALSILGESAKALPRAEAASALLEHLYGPRSCTHIPHRLLVERYAQTRWRFMAPPAWRVEDLQLLCCDTPRDCQRPEAVDCVARRANEARELAAALQSETPGPDVLEREVERVRAEQRQAARSEYVFYFDPDAPDAKVDGRLQTVDRPIAEAVSSAQEERWIGPIMTRFGHHLLRIIGRRDGIALTLADPRTQALLVTELCPAFLVDQRDRYGNELIRTQGWSVDPTALARAFELDPP